MLKQRIRAKAGILSFIFVLFAVAGFLQGCNMSCSLLESVITKLEFRTDEITLVIGEEVDLYDYLNISPAGSAADIQAQSSDENIVQVSYANLAKAFVEGTATLTVTSGKLKDTCRVKAMYAALTDLDIHTDGRTEQKTGETARLIFSAALTANSDPDTEILWDVNGAYTGNYGANFAYIPPNRPGAYEITARAGDLIAHQTVRVYQPFASLPYVEVSGSRVQNAASAETVAFELIAAGADDNPPAVVRWYVNGTLAEENAEGMYRFCFVPPAAGIYEIAAEVNGDPVAFAGGTSLYIIEASGAATPARVRLEYNNIYPNVRIAWQADPHLTRFGLFIQNGKTTQQFTTDSHPGLFEGCSFDATGLMDLKNTYTIGVKSLGEEKVFFESEYATARTEKLTAKALEYLSKKYFDGDYYITSDREFLDIYEYTMLFRPNAVTVKYDGKDCPSTTMSVFMAYTSQYTANRLSRIAWSSSAQAGYYIIDPPVGGAAVGNVLSVKLTYLSDNQPTKTTDPGSIRYQTLLMPHIDTSGELRSDALPIDDKPYALNAVSSSDELYFVVNKGYRPIVAKDSVAERMYDYARKTLRYIIQDGMSDLEKIHAIYDWILWRTHYDYKVVKIEDINESVKYKPYYLESVLTDDYPFTVCDGLAKTFSLLCNMEGIVCVRVTGFASSGMYFGQHAWNKVLYEGEWYNVDCTWGDYLVEINETGWGRANQYESASHQYLMVTDRELFATHRENNSPNFPPSAKASFHWFAQPVRHNDRKIDFFIGISENMDAQLDDLLDYIEASKPDDDTYTVGNAAPENVTNVAYYGQDIEFLPYFASELQSMLQQKLAMRGIRNYRLVWMGNFVTVLLKY